MFYGTNLLKRCPVTVPVFCCLFVSEKLAREVSPNRLKNYRNYFYVETKTTPGGDLQGAHRPQTTPSRGPRLGRGWAPPGHLLGPLESPFRL